MPSKVTVGHRWINDNSPYAKDECLRTITPDVDDGTYFILSEREMKRVRELCNDLAVQTARLKEHAIRDNTAQYDLALKLKFKATQELNKLLGVE